MSTTIPHAGRIVSVLAAALAMILAVLISDSAATAEEVHIETSMEPLGGEMFKESRVPVRSRLSVQVTVPENQTKILPLKRTRIKFDTDMRYNPDPRVTPACPDSKISKTSSLGVGIARMIDLCPRSVIGTGSSVIYLAKAKTGVLADPQMVIFNAGRDANGNPKMKIYGFSKQTGAGLLMEGSLNDRGVQDVPIGVLSFDSAVGSFVFDLPGTGMKVEDHKSPGGFKIVKGLDPGYVTAKCSDGSWSTGGDFFLGERDASTGEDVGDTSRVVAEPFEDRCQGSKGRPRVVGLRLGAPRVASSDGRFPVRMRLRNAGTATARHLSVSVKGAAEGRFRGSPIAPGATHNLVVHPRITARSGTTSKMVIRVNSDGSRIRFSRTIRVR